MEAGTLSARTCSASSTALSQQCRVTCVCLPAKSLQSCLTLVTPWTAAHQAPLSMGFSRQEEWGGWPCPPPAGLPNPGIKPGSLNSSALAGKFFSTSTTWEARG